MESLNVSTSGQCILVIVSRRYPGTEKMYHQIEPGTHAGGMPVSRRSGLPTSQAARPLAHLYHWQGPSVHLDGWYGDSVTARISPNPRDGANGESFGVTHAREQ